VKRGTVLLEGYQIDTPARLAAAEAAASVPGVKEIINMLVNPTALRLAAQQIKDDSPMGPHPEQPRLPQLNPRTKSRRRMT